MRSDYFAPKFVWVPRLNRLRMWLLVWGEYLVAKQKLEEEKFDCCFIRKSVEKKGLKDLGGIITLWVLGGVWSQGWNLEKFSMVFSLRWEGGGMDTRLKLREILVLSRNRPYSHHAGTENHSPCTTDGVRSTVEVFSMVLHQQWEVIWAQGWNIEKFPCCHVAGLTPPRW
jgi:hypothetical protein